MDLPGFDPATMTYLATQMQQPTMPGAGDPFHDLLLPAEYQDHHSTYGGYAGSDDLNLHGLPAPPAPPLLQRFSSGFEDPFSDVVSAFDTQLTHDFNEAESPSIDRDNKLLGFTLPTFDYTILDYTYRRTTISLTAQLHGMFFLAESPWAAAEDAHPPPSELTCYRRNLFQITGEVKLPRTLRYIMTDQGEQIAVIGQELVISASESTEGNAVKIISVPWKTPINPSQPSADDKVEREPPSFPLDLSSVQDMHSDFVTFPLQWKRLQFRIATANNGRRKELQQHFVVRLKVVAKLATGGKVPICEVQSAPIIVRGRSPRNFQSRNDLPLNNSGHHRKSSNLHSRASPGDNAKHRNDGPTSAPVKNEPAPAAMTSVASYFDVADAQVLNDNYDWTTATAQAHAGGGMRDALTAFPQTLSHHPDPSGQIYALSSPDLTRVQASSIPTAPINLSLVEDESPHRPASHTPPTGNDQRAPKRIQIPPRPPSFALHTSLHSPDESADLLYEYFPLGLDDWMPPVDAVYRPHGVHHVKLPTDPRDPKAGAKGARSKRLYSEDVS